jgi:hypothetical protein
MEGMDEVQPTVEAKRKWVAGRNRDGSPVYGVEDVDDVEEVEEQDEVEESVSPVQEYKVLSGLVERELVPRDPGLWGTTRFNDAYTSLTEGKWIQKAIKKPGALSKQLGVPEKKNIPAKKLRVAAKKPGKLGKRARLAITLKKLHKKEDVQEARSKEQQIAGQAAAGGGMKPWQAKLKAKDMQSFDKADREQQLRGYRRGMANRFGVLPGRQIPKSRREFLKSHGRNPPKTASNDELTGIDWYHKKTALKTAAKSGGRTGPQKAVAGSLLSFGDRPKLPKDVKKEDVLEARSKSQQAAGLRAMFKQAVQQRKADASQYQGLSGNRVKPISLRGYYADTTYMRGPKVKKLDKKNVGKRFQRKTVKYTGPYDSLGLTTAIRKTTKK